MIPEIGLDVRMSAFAGFTMNYKKHEEWGDADKWRKTN